MATQQETFGSICSVATFDIFLNNKDIEHFEEIVTGDRQAVWEIRVVIMVDGDSYRLDGEATFLSKSVPYTSFGLLKVVTTSSQAVTTNTSNYCHSCGRSGSLSRLQPPTVATLESRFKAGTDRLKLAKELTFLISNQKVTLTVKLFHFLDAGEGSSMVSLASSLQALPSDTCDVVFVVQGEEIQVHSLILAAVSKVFRAMLVDHETKEKITGKVEVKDVRWDVFNEMIRCIYADCPPDCDAADDDFLVELLVLSERFDLSRLKAECQQLYVDTMSAANVCQRLDTLARLPCPALTTATLAYFMKRPAPDSWTPLIADRQPELAALLERGAPRSPAGLVRVRATASGGQQETAN